MAWQQFVKLKV